MIPKEWGIDQWICTWYMCTKCNGDDTDNAYLAGFFKFCPSCGVKIDWERFNEQDK